jgi:Uma2 family endonuclease
MITIEEFIAEYNQTPFELMDGERILIPFPQMSGSHHDQAPTFGLHDYFESQGLGKAYTETPFIITAADDPNWVIGAYVPQAMFFQQARIEAYQHENPYWDAMPLALIPDLIVQVIDSTDAFSVISKRVIDYIRLGVPMMWLVDVQQRVILTCVQGNTRRTVQITRHTRGETVYGGDALPGFEMPVNQLFET